MRRHFSSTLTYFLMAIFVCITLIACQPTVPPTPSIQLAPGIRTIAKAVGMTDRAQQIFFAQQPQLITPEAFYSLCAASPEQESSVILGCFIRRQGEGKIFIQSIKDQRLKGTMEVVAAHEMLHAAYVQLTPSVREALAPKLEKAVQYYDNSIVLPVLENYRKTSYDTYINELHSYLGTELKNFNDPELESYYQRYFLNRQDLVALAQNSQNELHTAEKQIKQLEAEITTLKSYLETEKVYLEGAVQEIKRLERSLSRQQQQRDIQLSQRKNKIIQGDFNALNEFDRSQTQFTQASNEIENLIREYQRRNLDYEEKLYEYNFKVDEYTNLTKNRGEILKELQDNRSIKN